MKECEAGPVIITRNGKPAAVLLPIQDEDELERLILSYSPKFQAILKQGRQQIKQSGGINHDEFWQDEKLQSTL